MNDHKVVEDFTLQPVPDADTMSGLQIGTVILAVGFTLPLFTLGAQIAQAQGLAGSAGIFFLACGLVGLVSLATSVVGARLRISTYVILERTFGTLGGKFLNLLLAVSLLGWFSNVADLLGTTVSGALRDTYEWHVPSFACSAIAVALMTTTAIFGFRMMERFASVMVPLLCIFMLYVTFLSLHRSDFGAALAKPGDGSIDFIASISAIVGLFVLTAVLAPDFTRYARDDRAALVSVGGLAFGYPLIMLIAAIPATMLGQADIMRIMVALGVPGLALVLLVLSTWTSNTGNLYSTTLTLATLLPRAATWQLGVGGAIIALAAAYFHVSDYFVPFLIAMGIGIAPVAGVYICEVFVAKGCRDAAGKLPAIRPANLLAFVAGAAVGYASERMGGIVMPIPAFDGLLFSMLMWFVLNLKRVRRVRG